MKIKIYPFVYLVLISGIKGTPNPQISISLPIIGGITLGQQSDSTTYLTSTFYSTTTLSSGSSFSFSSFIASPSSDPSSISTPSSSGVSTTPATLTHHHSASSSGNSAKPSVIIITQTVQVIVTASNPPTSLTSMNLTTSSSTSSSPSTYSSPSAYISTESSIQPTPSSSLKQGDSSDASTSSKQTAGIAVGSVLGGVAALSAIVFLAIRTRRKQDISTEMNETTNLDQSFHSPSLSRRLSARLGLMSNASPPPMSDIESNPAAAAWWAAATAASASHSPFEDDNASIGRKSDDTIRPRTPTSLFGFSRRTSTHVAHPSSTASRPNSPRPTSSGGDPFRSALDNYHIGR